MYTASVCSVMVPRPDEVSRRTGPDHWHALRGASVRTGCPIPLGVVAKRQLEAARPLSSLTSGDADDLGCAEGVEAVHERDADEDLGGLTVGVSRRDAFAEGLEAPHLRLDAASGVVSRPSLPKRLAKVPDGAQGLVARLGSRAVLFPSSSVPSFALNNPDHAASGI